MAKYFLFLLLITTELVSWAALGEVSKSLAAANESEETGEAKEGAANRSSPEALASEGQSQKTPPVSPEARELLTRVNDRYRKSKALQMRLNKKVLQAVLGRESQYEGQLWSVPKKLRIEFTQPSFSAVVVDGQFVWMETHTPKELGGGIQVAKTKVDYSKKSQGWMALLGRRRIDESFAISKSTNRDGNWVFELEPKTTFQDLTRAELEISTKDEKIVSVKYWDDLENETTLNFSRIQVGGNLKPSLFKYVPPKGVEVTAY